MHSTEPISNGGLDGAQHPLNGSGKPLETKHEGHFAKE